MWKIKVSAFARIRTLVAQPIAYSLRHTGENVQLNIIILTFYKVLYVVLFEDCS